MIKKYIIVAFAILFISCNENNEPTNNDIGISIWIKEDLTSANLLNPENHNSFKKEDIRVYSLDENGEKKELFTPNLDAPRYFYIYPYNNKGVIENLCMLSPYLGKTNKTETTTTLVEWSSGVVDAIKCEIYKSGGVTIVRKVWCNNVLKYDVADKSVNNTSLENVTRLIEISK